MSATNTENVKMFPFDQLAKSQKGDLKYNRCYLDILRMKYEQNKTEQEKKLQYITTIDNATERNTE